jgi:hypothetical protein
MAVATGMIAVLKLLAGITIINLTAQIFTAAIH